MFLPTTIPFHAWILANRDFQEQGIDIGYVERTFKKEDAEQALALLASDPAHRGAGVTETVPGSDGSGAVLLTHEEGGTFLAQPLTEDGSLADSSTWRRAASRAAVLG